jgi:guanylate kinase
VSEGKGQGGLLFVVSGPSGSGKTTLLEGLLRYKELRRRLVQSVSFTTRPKRSGERQAREYFFISAEQFRQKQKAKKILEWTKYLGYYYATPRDFIEERVNEGRHVILCLDLKGALKIRRLYPERSVTIFIIPPSITALRERIKGRCNKTRQEEIRQRLRLARQELAASCRYDYCLENKDLRETLKGLRGIILKEIVSHQAR